MKTNEQFLAEVLPPVRDRETGRYSKVVLRKKCLDFLELVDDYHRAHGGSVEDSIIEIYHSLMKWAKLGDTGAAKLLLDRLCGKEVERVEVAVHDSLSDVERAARLQAILAAAAARHVADEQRPRVTISEN